MGCFVFLVFLRCVDTSRAWCDILALELAERTTLCGLLSMASPPPPRLQAACCGYDEVLSSCFQEAQNLPEQSSLLDWYLGHKLIPSNIDAQWLKCVPIIECTALTIPE